jgi:Domain of unknown function (DUF4261)
MAASKPTQTDKREPIIVTLLLERPATINYGLLYKRIRKILDFKPGVGHRPDFPMVLIIDGDIVGGMKVDGPFPEPLDALAQHAYWWPNALADVARTKSYIAVTSYWSKHSRMDAHLRHLVLVRELVNQLPVIGVLWNSVLVQPAILEAEFQRLQNGELPVSLWILIQFSKQPNGNNLISTVGMYKFELMEIETESSLPLDHIFNIVRQFGSYLIGKGPVVNDGETIGQNETERIKVRHIPSFRPDVAGNVYWLDFVNDRKL